MPTTDQTPDPAHRSAGGPGEDRPTRSELALLRLAANQRWPVSAAHRQVALNALTAILTAKNTDPDAPSPRERVGAIKALISMDQANLDWMKFDRDDPSAGKDDGDYEIDLSPPRPPKDLPERPV